MDYEQQVNNLLYSLDKIQWAEALGFIPDPWQRKLLKSESKRVILLCSRQSGKSSIAAIIALHTALYKDGALILIVSKSQRQGQELFRKIKEYSLGVAYLPQMVENTLTSCTFANGSRIICIPGTESSVRGYSAVDLIIEDEASRVEDEMYTALRPMLAISNGRFMLLSTPWGKRGHFYETWIADNEWEKVKMIAADCPRISEDFLAKELIDLGTYRFDQEYNCVFQDLIDNIFAQEDIEAAFNNDLEPFFGDS